jgi:hypothetical protein
LALGKTIRIYLADSTVSGIKHGEIANWTGQAVACPRSKFQDLREWPEAKRPGVYFLFGSDEETGQEAVYIGEAEIVVDRLLSHLSEKDFWSEVIAFTSKDDNLTKGHVRYLESRLINIATTVGRYIVKNGNCPQLTSLPRPDRDAMEEYLEATRILLGVLGHKVLEPLLSGVVRAQAQSENSAQLVPKVEPEGDVTSTPKPIILTSFRLSISGLTAYATKTDEGFVVVETSEAANAVQPSLSVGYRALREKLIQAGILVQDGEKLRFAKSQLFNSPSQAAAIVVGYSINGRDAWKMQDGRTYGAYEHGLAQSSLNEFLSGFKNG